ncbi:MAG: Marinomonas phage [Pseudomonadota bacterium]
MNIIPVFDGGPHPIITVTQLFMADGQLTREEAVAQLGLEPEAPDGYYLDTGELLSPIKGNASPLEPPELSQPPSAWATYLDAAEGLDEAWTKVVDTYVDEYQNQLYELGFDVPFFDVSDEDFAAATTGATTETGAGDEEGADGKSEPPFPTEDDGLATPVFAWLEVQEPERLADWCREVGIMPLVIPAKPTLHPAYHLTTVYGGTVGEGDREPIDDVETLDPATYRWARLGADGRALALVVESQLARACNMRATEAGAVHGFPAYLPHITVSYDHDGPVPERLPDFPITVGPEVILGPAKTTKSTWGEELELKVDPGNYEGIGDEVPDEDLAAAAAESIEDIIQDFGRRTYRVIDVEASFTVKRPAVMDFLKKFGAERIKELVGTTTRRELADAMAKVTSDGPTFPKLVKAIRGVFARAKGVRAEIIARTETTRAAGYGAQAAIARGNVERKMWLSSRDAFVRDAHSALDGQIVEADKPFVWEGNEAMYPGDFGKPKLDINCRCLSIPLPDEKSAAELADKAARDTAWKAVEQRLRHHEEILAAALREGFARQERAVLAALRRRLP